MVRVVGAVAAGVGFLLRFLVLFAVRVAIPSVAVGSIVFGIAAYDWRLGYIAGGVFVLLAMAYHRRETR